MRKFSVFFYLQSNFDDIEGSHEESGEDAAHSGTEDSVSNPRLFLAFQYGTVLPVQLPSSRDRWRCFPRHYSTYTEPKTSALIQYLKSKLTKI